MFFNSDIYKNKDKKKDEIDKFLLEQQAKSDALYPYNKNSIEPIVEGAWKGAIASSIFSKGYEYWKRDKDPSFKMGFKPFAVHSAGGAAIGALTNYLINRRRVEQKKEALDYLYNNRNTKYIREKKKLLKTSGINSSALEDTVKESNDSLSPQKRTQKEIAKDSVISGSLVGLGMGIVNAFRKGKGSFTRGFVTGGSLGASQTAVSEELENKMHDDHKKMSLAQQMALTGAISTATEPLIYRGIGFVSRHANDGKSARLLIGDNIEQDDVEKLNKRMKEKGVKTSFKNSEDVIKHYSDQYEKGKVPFLTKLKHTLIPNATNSLKDYYDSDALDTYRGMKGKLFDKTLVRHMAGKALWGAGIGYGAGKLLDYLQQKSQKNRKS